MPKSTILSVCVSSPPPSQNPTQVGVSLQVFYNLGQLSPSLSSVLAGFREALQHESQTALDPATLTQGLEGEGVCVGV